MNGSETKAGKGALWFYNKAMAVCQCPTGKYDRGCPLQVDCLTHHQGAAGKMRIFRADHFGTVGVAPEQCETRIAFKKANDVFCCQGANHAGKTQLFFKGQGMGKQSVLICQQKRQIAKIIDRSRGNGSPGVMGIVQGYGMIVIALYRPDGIVLHKCDAGIGRLRRGGIANVAEMNHAKAILFFQKGNGVR